VEKRPRFASNMLSLNFIGIAHIVCRVGFMNLSGVCPSVCPNMGNSLKMCPSSDFCVCMRSDIIVDCISCWYIVCVAHGYFFVGVFLDSVFVIVEAINCSISYT